MVHLYMETLIYGKTDKEQYKSRIKVKNCPLGNKAKVSNTCSQMTCWMRFHQNLTFVKHIVCLV